MSDKIKLTLLFIALTLLTLFLYFPAFYGGFILDDVANLFNLKIYNDYEGIEALVNYLSSFSSGFLKRPISTLTFLLNASNWPAEPFWFKVTNFVIHIMNGLLLFFATKYLLLLAKINQDIIIKVAILSTTIWLLHPFFISTVMYVVQRMAMLVATFSLIGIILYCKGRLMYEDNRRKSILYMIFAIFVCTTLATLCKENGILLPFLIYLIELLLVKKSNIKQLTRLHRFLLFYSPMLVVLFAFTYKTPEFLSNYQFKNFNLTERLLSQTRILTYYLYHLFKPEYLSEGIFGDGIMKSTNIIEPISTLFSTIFISLIIVVSIIFCKKTPLISFCVLFFFVGHLIESTYIPLDLYYEHRNYLPAFFLPLPIALLLIKLQEKKNIFVIFPIVLILFLSFNTYLKNRIWKDNATLYLASASKYPESMRASTILASMIADQGHVGSAINILNKSYKKNRNLGMLANIMTLKCRIKELTKEDFEKFYKRLNHVDFTFDLIVSFNHLLNSLEKYNCNKHSEHYSLLFLNRIREQQKDRFDNTTNNINFSFALLYFKYGEYDKGMLELENFIDVKNSLPIFYMSQEIIDLLIEKKEYDYALKVLQKLQPILSSSIYKVDLYQHKEKAQNYISTIEALRAENE